VTDCDRHNIFECDSSCHRADVAKVIDTAMYALCPVCKQKNGANEMHDNCSLERLEGQICDRRRYLAAQAWWKRNVLKEPA